MILPCLVCLALLTASAVPVVANEVETCSSEEVSNVCVSNVKPRVVYSNFFVTFLIPYREYVDASNSVTDFDVNTVFTGQPDVYYGSSIAEVLAGSDTLVVDSYENDQESHLEVVIEIDEFVEAAYYFIDVEIEAQPYAFVFQANAGDTWSVDVSEEVFYYNLNTADLAPDGVSIVREIVEILVSSITQLGAGIGGGVNAFAQALAFDVSGEALSVFMVFVAAFAALALAVGLTRLIFGWLQNLGGH